MRLVTLKIDEELLVFAAKHAAAFGHDDAQDYLSGLLNMALITAIDDYENGRLIRLPESRPRHRPEWMDELEEDPGGGMQRKEDDALPPDDSDDDDLDDGIPF